MTRHYTLSIPVTITDNADLDHFQPGTVVAETPLGHVWVSGNDREALEQFFAFCMRFQLPDDMSISEYGQSGLAQRHTDARWQIIARAMRGHEADSKQGET